MPVRMLVGEHNGLRSIAWAGFEQDSADVAVDCLLGHPHRWVLSAFDGPRATSTSSSCSPGVSGSSSAGGSSGSMRAAGRRDVPGSTPGG